MFIEATVSTSYNGGVAFDDFAGTLHAACLLFVPLLTGGFVFAFSAAPNRERALWAGVIAVAMGAVYAALGGYFRAGGWPVMQLALPLACAWGGLFIGVRPAQRGFGVGLLVATIGLLTWFALLTQGRYVGRADWVGEQQGMLDVRKALVVARLMAVKSDTPVEYKPAWLAESDIVRRDHPWLAAEALEGNVERAQSLWHTWLTSLWARGPVRVALWFPGGTLVEGAARLEWRAR